MRKEKIKVVVLGTFLTVVMFAAIGMVGTMENTYTRKDCVVVAVQGNMVTAEDTCGYVWSWFVDEDTNIYKGDKVDLKMDTRCTNGTVYDDEVIDFKMGVDRQPPICYNKSIKRKEVKQYENSYY